MIVIAGTASIQPQHWDEAVQQARRMEETTRAETGCIDYRFYVRPLEQTSFFIFEQWETPEALARHFQTPHMQTFSAYLAKVLAGPLDIKRYEVSSVSAL